MNSKIKPDYYYSTPDKTSSNNHNHNHDHLTTTAGTTTYSYPMCRSAFESDPEVVLLRQHRLATRMTARPQSPTTPTTADGGQHRYVTTTTTTTTTNKNYNNDSNRNNDDDYMGMNLFSCRLKKEASAASIGKEEYDDDDTVESTHLDSDYAKSPIFPSDAYGSRPSVHIPTGIYSNKVF